MSDGINPTEQLTSGDLRDTLRGSVAVGYDGGLTLTAECAVNGIKYVQAAWNTRWQGTGMVTTHMVFSTTSAN